MDLTVIAKLGEAPAVGFMLKDESIKESLGMMMEALKKQILEDVDEVAEQGDSGSDGNDSGDTSSAELPNEPAKAVDDSAVIVEGSFGEVQ